MGSECVCGGIWASAGNLITSGHRRKIPLLTLVHCTAAPPNYPCTPQMHPLTITAIPPHYSPHCAKTPPTTAPPDYHPVLRGHTPQTKVHDNWYQVSVLSYIAVFSAFSILASSATPSQGQVKRPLYLTKSGFLSGRVLDFRD